MYVFAYLDPGTGSFILQGIIAGVLGSLVVIKSYWHRLKALFSRSATPPSDDAGDSGRSES